VLSEFPSRGKRHECSEGGSIDGGGSKHRGGDGGVCCCDSCFARLRCLRLSLVGAGV